MSNIREKSPPSRTISLSTNASEDITIPSELSITGSSQSFDIIATDDSLFEESYNVTLTDSYASFELNSSGSTLSDSLDILVTINDNDVASYSLSSNKNSVNENGTQVVFSISSNVRKSVDPITFSIKKISNGLSADNIASVTGVNVTLNPSINTPNSCSFIC